LPTAEVAPTPTREAVLDAAIATPGFFPLDEGTALHRVAKRAVASGLGPLVEIGAYLGRSTLFIAAALCQPATEHRSDAVLFSVDHHRGSIEMQSGFAAHDPRLVDEGSGLMDSLPHWRRAVLAAGLEPRVIAIVGESSLVAVHWRLPVSLVLIDGGHAAEVEWADYRGWARHIAPGGFLVIHDVFADPEQGGRPPYECYRDALETGEFVEDVAAGRNSLRVLVRVGASTRPPKTEEVAAPRRKRSAASTTAAAE
jgi:predicted O-methyltransferase YrrM